MIILKNYEENMQIMVEKFFEKCFSALGWQYEPYGRHNDIKNIHEIYVKNGNFLCLVDNETVVGTVAIHSINEIDKIIEMKRLYILPECQGKGYGNFLFKTALNLTKINNYEKIRIETREDRKEILHFVDKYKFIRIEKYSTNNFANLFFEKKMNEYKI